MADPGSVLLAHGPSTGGIRRHVDALAHGLLARGWDVTTAPLPAGPAAWRRLRHLSGHVDVVHAHGLRTGWWAALVPRRPPVVVTIHNVVLDDVAGWKAPVLRHLERMLPRRVD